MMPWVKLYTDMLDDKQMKRAARKGSLQLHLLPWLWLYAGEADDGGRLTVGGVPADADDIADCIPSQLANAQAVQQCIDECLALEGQPILTRDEDGALRLATWEAKAAIAPSETKEAAAERKRQQRAREREERERTEAERLEAERIAQSQSECAVDDADVEEASEEQRHAESRPVTTGHAVTLVTGHTESHDVSRPRCRCRGRCRCRDREETSLQAGSRAGVLVDSTSPEHRILLTQAANSGISARFGEQPSPIQSGNAHTSTTVEALAKAGVELLFAERVVHECAKALPLDMAGTKRMPKHLSYFREVVLERWGAECAHRQASSYVAPAPGEVGQAGDAPTGEAQLQRIRAIEGAKRGDPSWIKICQENGFDYGAAA